MTTEALPRPAGAAALIRTLRTDPRAALGFVIVALAAVAAVLAPLVAPYPPDLPDFVNTLSPAFGNPLAGH